MKIKITSVIPVEELTRPVVGGVYDVIDQQRLRGGSLLFFVNVNGEKVGVYEDECVEYKERGN